MKIIRISVDNEITVHEYPTGSYSEQYQKFRELIGTRCRSYEHVMPKRLYTELGGSNKVTNEEGNCVSMLVDAEGLYHDLKINRVGSYLYETDKHGYAIVGNILIIGEKWDDEGIGFCGISDKQFDSLYSQLERLVKKARGVE